MKIQITRKFEFDAGHRVLGHEGKCRNLHGHRYVAEVSVEGPELDDLGRVVDFSSLKVIVGTWIDSFWDHNMILHKNDPLLNLDCSIGGGVRGQETVLIGRNPYVMPDWAPNPTVENMVKVLAEACQNLLSKTSLTVTKIKMYETPNCWAEWNREIG